MNALNSIQMLAVIALPVLFAITAHEAAHGWMAGRLGDGTAKMLGRVTLNPLKHIDLVGTVLVPLTIYWVTAKLGGTGLLFGWAKPVPINMRNLNNPRRDMALVALAGPGANLLMAVLWGLVAQIGLMVDDVSPLLAEPLKYMGAAGMLFNAILMALNLFPLLPLDGGRVLNAFLPPAWSANFSRLEPYGLLVLLVFIFIGLLGAVIWPVVWATIDLLPGSGVFK